MVHQYAIAVTHVEGSEHHGSANRQLAAMHSGIREIRTCIHPVEHSRRCQVDEILLETRPIREHRQQLPRDIFGNGH